MAQNAALAIALASRLGVSEKQIQAALAAWRPAKWRGELFRDPGGRLLYLDLYNANPASMADALDAFASIAPAELPRLYVLGCMEELGPDAARHHRELGAQLRLRPQDEVFVIGTHAADVKAGAPAPEASRIEILDTLAPAAARVASFRGAIFLKGSRRYELEKALPPSSSESL